MNEKIQRGKEKNIEWAVDLTHSNFAIISICKDNKLLEEYVYHYAYRPIFGIDAGDYRNIENKLDELINKWGD